MLLAKVVDPRFIEALNRLIKTEKLPIRVAFRLNSVAKKVNEALKTYDDVRQAKLNELGTKKEDGTLDQDEKGQIQFTPENLTKFATELGELVNEDINIGTIKLEALGEGIQISMADVEMLDGLIIE